MLTTSGALEEVGRNQEINPLPVPHCLVFYPKTSIHLLVCLWRLLGPAYMDDLTITGLNNVIILNPPPRDVPMHTDSPQSL